MKSSNVVLAGVLLAGAYLVFGAVFPGGPSLSNPLAPKSPSPDTPAAKNVILLFSSDHCLYCDQLAEEMRKPEAQKALASFTVQMIKNDRKLERRYKVKGYPTLVVIDPARPLQPLGTKAGFMTATELATFLDTCKTHRR